MNNPNTFEQPKTKIISEILEPMQLDIYVKAEKESKSDDIEQEATKTSEKEWGETKWKLNEQITFSYSQDFTR